MPFYSMIRLLADTQQGLTQSKLWSKAICWCRDLLDICAVTEQFNGIGRSAILTDNAASPKLQTLTSMRVWTLAVLLSNNIFDNSYHPVSGCLPFKDVVRQIVSCQHDIAMQNPWNFWLVHARALGCEWDWMHSVWASIPQLPKTQQLLHCRILLLKHQKASIINIYPY